MSLNPEHIAVAKRSNPEKDIWDKIVALTPAIVTLMLGLLGWHATDTYNSNSLRLQQAQANAALQQQKAQAEAANLLAQTQTLDNLFPYIAASDPRKRLFGYTMYAHLGDEELAAKLVALNDDVAGKPLLVALRASPKKSVQDAASAGLLRLAMGQLEMGTNRQGYDFDAFGKPAQNPQLCAEMCRVDATCKAMTYVVSRKTCWLKIGVPQASSDMDMISAVKVSSAG
jgi:hypothetical protein